MKRGNFKFGSNLRWCFVLVMVLVFNTTQAQRRLDAKGGISAFLDTQWWLGLKFGTNVTSPIIGDRYSVLSPVNYAESDLDKAYDDFTIPGFQAGLDATFYTKGFSIGLQPAFKFVVFSYENRLNWELGGQQEAFSTRYQIRQGLNTLEVPLTVKYDLIKRGKLRPYVIAGGFYSFVLSGRKKVEVDHRDAILNTDIDGGEVTIGKNDEFKDYAGVLGGVGASFDYGNIRILLDITYQRALLSAIEPEALFTENQLFAIGNITDDISLSHINASLGIVFPLRFIDNTFQSSR